MSTTEAFTGVSFAPAVLSLRDHTFRQAATSRSRTLSATATKTPPDCPMLPRGLAIMSSNSSALAVSHEVLSNHVVTPPTDGAVILAVAPAQRTATMSPTASEVQRDLIRVWTSHVSVNDRHRALFRRYLNLPAMVRAKVTANVMTTMESLGWIAETLKAADTKLNAAEAYPDCPVPAPSEEELREAHHDVREAQESIQLIRSRVDRIERAIERLEAANEQPFDVEV
ncbi:hypothetical protein CERZMDRAFT_90146 [Cercospora zeae-maydis SCOH1-5]|uniref:Uncharacterized protein n=1 Tax=Cercospora zeae-maydis SCOH1-5 TaxID=717836 RepID=A0A6A6FQ54_9PEZI|nr:hypothetical protein CERZMDRAFT_90146 [Cercospora zeae-maydis SCOH1-5]